MKTRLRGEGLTLLILCFAAFTLYGMYYNGFGTNAEATMAYFGIDEVKNGAIMTVQAVGCMAITILLGLYGERLNKIYALGAGLLLLGAAGVLIGLMPQFMAVGSYALMLLTGKRMKPQTPYADMEEIRGRARQNPAEIFREGSAWQFLLSGFMNLSFQTGLTTWLPRYCSLVWDYDLTAAGLMVTMYFMGALVMRLLSPFVYRKLGVKRYYQLTLLVSAALYLVFLLLPMPDWCRKAMVFALGLLQGATVPTLVILCCDAFPERTASASSVVVTGVSLASMVSPVVLGKLLTIDPQTAMLSITVCTVIAALVLPKSRKA